MLNIQPTPHQDINKILNLLLENIKEILKDQFIGMYLYGSLSSGDFNPKSSDIDFLVVTKDTLPGDIVSELESMHKHIWKTGLKWASKLEGSYVPKELIRCHEPNGAPCPTVNEGKFFVDKRG
ncbi:MAG TPA: nucleotidyltransferase domain-containing protein, partial [Anaerolineales bacterium]|nr:nucleotidyltransferase domain-containing protein [Anaerolineales bacterium]